jgi:hypothetical protein
MARFAASCFVAGLAALAVSACSDDATRNFGTTRNGPDQPQVALRLPLSVPPLLTQRPPRLGAPPNDTGAPTNGTAEDAAVSPGQGALVDAAGPAPPSNIRQRVEQDAQVRHQDQAFTDELLSSPPGPRQNAGGTAPTIQQGGKSWLGSIF